MNKQVESAVMFLMSVIKTKNSWLFISLFLVYELCCSGFVTFCSVYRVNQIFEALETEQRGTGAFSAFPFPSDKTGISGTTVKLE